MADCRSRLSGGYFWLIKRTQGSEFEAPVPSPGLFWCTFLYVMGTEICSWRLVGTEEHPMGLGNSKKESQLASWEGGVRASCTELRRCINSQTWCTVEYLLSVHHDFQTTSCSDVSNNRMYGIKISKWVIFLQGRCVVGLITRRVREYGVEHS